MAQSIPADRSKKKKDIRDLKLTAFVPLLTSSRYQVRREKTHFLSSGPPLYYENIVFQG